MCESIPHLNGEKIVLKRMVNGSLRLGISVGEFDISSVNGKYIIKFKVKGVESKLSIILDGGQIKQLTSVMWNKYLTEEREEALEDFKDIFPVLL